LFARPIIYACRSLNNPVEEAQAGLSVEPSNPEAIADAIRRLKQLPAEEQRQMGLRGRAWVTEHHDMRKLASKLEATLSTLIAGKGG